MKMIMQFLKDTEWGKLDFLIIDSPPGTGDEPLTVAQLIPDITGAVIVTTPQEVALLDVLKAISFAKKLNMRILGIVGNMGKLICPYCGGEIELFKSEKLKEVAQKEKIQILGEIPFEPEIVQASDQGRPFIQEDNLSSKAMWGVIDRILQAIKLGR